MTVQFRGQEPVAIVGISCEFAGDIHSPVDLWEALRTSRDIGSEVPPERMDLQSYAAHLVNQYNDDQLLKKLIRRGYFLSNSLWDTFEPSFFGISDSEAVTIDPCHRLLLLKFVHLIDDAGYTLEKMSGSRTSVHIGQFSADQMVLVNQMKVEYKTRHHGANTMLYNASGRLSYHFNLHGPNLVLDVACSSSMEAVHLGIQSLLTGEVDMAVCGGVNSVISLDNLFAGSLIGAQSPDGRSRSFSVGANGYAKGEGVGLVLLKRLSDAERDGDRIYCVLRDVLTNHDGNEGKNGFAVPSPIGQTRLLHDVYKRAEVDPKRIFYVEAHGTGTPVGDPIEANALGSFFNRSPMDSPLLIGSVKSNLGHTEGTAGIAALIKVAMCMRYRAIPPNMHFTALNPSIEAQRYNLHIIQHLVQFPPRDENAKITIGINSFGMGGNNSHAIVEEYWPQQGKITNGESNGYGHGEHDKMLNGNTNGHSHAERDNSNQQFLFIFSTKSRESLNKQITQFNTWLNGISAKCDVNNDSYLALISQQLLLKRTISYDQLAIMIFANRTQLQEQIDAFLTDQAAPGLTIAKRPAKPIKKICFVFSGQGPQWWSMGRQLYESEPVFRQWIQRINTELNKVNNNDWCLLDELIGKKNESESRINDTNIAQPGLFAVQVALAALLVSWQIYPSAIVSHSAGEQAAAFVSGRTSLEEACRIVYHRSRLQHRNTRQGGRMLAVSMSEQEVKDVLLRDVEHLACVAVVNSARSVTISGDETIVDELQQTLTTFHPDVFKARLRIENAFHSQQMDRFNIKEEMLATLGDIPGLPLRVKKQMFDEKCAQARLYSSVNGNYVDDHTPLDAHHWWSNVRNCVRFADAITAIVRDEAADAFLEISPHPVLATSIRECCEPTSLQPLIFPTLKRKENEQTTLLTSVAQLTSSDTVWQQYLKSRTVLPVQDDDTFFDTFPLYTFDTTPYWYEAKEKIIERRAYRIPTHPLLGVRQWTDHTTAGTWRSLINLNRAEHMYLKDHKIQAAILFPATGFLELAVAAYRQLVPTTDDKPVPLVFENIEFIKALVLTERELTEVFTEVSTSMDEWFVYSRPWTGGSESKRTTGLSGSDIIDSYVDHQTLSQFSRSQFTLHVRGHITAGGRTQQHPLLLNDISQKTWSLDDSTSVYAHLTARGYEYGPCFQRMKSLGGNKSQVEAEIICTDNIPDDQKANNYHVLNPSIVDAGLHPLLALLPGSGTTFLPVKFGKVTVFADAPTSSHSTVQICAGYRDNVCGVEKEKAYNCDLMISSADSTNKNPLMLFENCVLQQVQGSQSGRWLLSKTVFDKLNISMDVPNRDFTVHLNKIVNDYGLKTVWTTKTILRSAADLLPSSKEIASCYVNTTVEQDLIESIKPLNELAARYAEMALNGFDVESVNPEHQLLLDACRTLASHSKVQSTFYSTQIQLMHLFEQFPRLESLLTVLATWGTHLKQVLTGEQAGLEQLLTNEKTERGLQQMQTLISNDKMRHVFQAIDQHFRKLQKQNGDNSLIDRKLRIMWLGSSTVSDALPAIQLLLDMSRETGLTVDLHYIDTNPTVIAQAKQTFSTLLADQNHLNITYDSTFDLIDIENNKMTVDESYDIVFAVNKVPVNQGVTSSLVAIRRVLIPNGLLVLLELTNVPLYYDLIFGMLDSWWSESSNGRALLNDRQWIEAVREVSGFEVAQTIPGQCGNSLIIARKTISNELLQTLNERQNQAWLIFADDHTHSIGHAIAPLLPSTNVTFIHQSKSKLEDIRSTLYDMMTKYERLHIVFAWPVDQKPLSDGGNEDIYSQLENQMCGTIVHILQFIQTANPIIKPFVYVITRNAQPGAGNNLNPAGAPIIGLVRSLIIEYERHRLKLVDLQSSSSSTDESLLVDALAKHLVASRYVDDLDEIILQQDNKDQVKRIQWHYEMLQQQKENQSESKSKCKSIIPCRDADNHPFRLRVAPSRFLADLAWVPDNRTYELLPGQVEVRVHCVGINMRDVLKARGLYPHTRPFAQADKDQISINRDTEPGLDSVGTVVRASPNVNFKPGDRVLGFTSRGMFHSHIVFDHRELVHITDECRNWTDEQLSAIPTAAITVIYSLKYRVHIRPGMTVLVHAATGGAGQICIQYCQAVGARVLATAGSEAKRRFLREQYGIEHVFNSRDLSFVNGVRAVCPNGVDVVVNSLAGALFQESVKLLDEQGHFVEWGKRDIFNKDNLSLFELRSDCSFHTIDIALLDCRQLDILGEVLQDVMQCVVQGKFKPIEPMIVHEPSEVIEAFNRFSSGQTMGRSVIRVTSSEKSLSLEVDQNHASNSEENMFSYKLCNEGTVLISGGFGGLGLTMSRWMIEERDVKHIALMSRRTLKQLEQPDNPQYEDWQRLKTAANEHGAHVDVVQADVTKFDQVRDLIERLGKTPFPVRGILHSAVVEEDRNLAKLTQDVLIRVLGPKIRGAWNLHQASLHAHAPLHFFIMFSSIRNHLIDLAAGGYNAGNQFLDILAQYRTQQLNLPALSVSLPAVSGAGMFHRHREFLTALSATQGFELVPTLAVFELIERFHGDQMSCSCPIIFAANWKKLHETGSKIATYQLSNIVEQQHKATDESATSGSASAGNASSSSYNSVETIIERTQATVARLLGATNVERILIDRSLVSQGMDSLAAISLYNWLGQETGVYVPLADLLQGVSVQSIATFVLDKLKEQQQTDSSSTNSKEQLDEPVLENEIEVSSTTLYTGTEHIQCLRNSGQGDSSIVFCISDGFTTDAKDSSEFFAEKMSAESSQIPSAVVYILRIPSTSSVKSKTSNIPDLISQIRRVQPRGPYRLVAMKNGQGEAIARQMIEQLKNYSSAPVTELLLLDEHGNKAHSHRIDGNTAAAKTVKSTTTIKA